LKAEDVTPGSEIANLIGMLYFCIVYMYMSYVNLREGNGEFQVVAEAAWLLAHIAKLQPIHRLLRPGAESGR
jgi:hypothetical protein